MSAKKLYVIGNSHMDPIWLWRLREGRSTWLNTCRSVVKMMQKYPQLKFSRSSSVAYRWVEESDPALFREIVRLVDAGRWELVGGWVEQSDTIITPGESLIRQAEHGKAYFQNKFGRDVRIAYSVDSFGQNAGLPKILNRTGFDYYVWMRPMAHEKEMPHLFRWQADDGSSDVVSFRVRQAYCTMPFWKEAKPLLDWIDQLVSTGDEHQTFFFGVGDHGGGFYERQLQWLLQAAERYDIEFSTLENYFKVIEKTDLPIVTGEHTHHAPGCYSAVGEIKEWMADAEKNLYKAEKIVLENHFDDAPAATEKLYNAWEELLFNYFHDVYPGTSSRDSYRCEIRDLCGMANKTAVDVLELHLSRLGALAKTDFLTEGGVLVWNPLAQPVTGVIRFDTFSDPNCHGANFNVLRAADGREIPLQWIRAAASFGPGMSWGRAVATLPLEASGLTTWAYGRSEQESPAIGFDHQYQALKRMRFAVLNDTFDTWAHDARALGETIGYAEQTGVEEIENGPVVSRLRVHYSWKQSVFHLDLFAYAGICELEAVWQGNWQETDDTLKFCWQTGKTGGEIVSGQALTVLGRAADDREQPFLDWVAATDDQGATGVLAHALHSYDSVGTTELRLTVLRPVHYAEHVPFAPHGDEGYADVGLMERRFWLFDRRTADVAAEVPSLARERLWSAEHLEITAAADGSELRRDQWAVEPAALVVAAQRRNADGSVTFHLENPTGESLTARILRNGTECFRATLPPRDLRLIRLAE